MPSNYARTHTHTHVWNAYVCVCARRCVRSMKVTLREGTFICVCVFVSLRQVQQLSCKVHIVTSKSCVRTRSCTIFARPYNVNGSACVRVCARVRKMTRGVLLLCVRARVELEGVNVGLAVQKLFGRKSRTSVVIHSCRRVVFRPYAINHLVLMLLSIGNRSLARTCGITFQPTRTEKSHTLTHTKTLYTTQQCFIWWRKFTHKRARNLRYACVAVAVVVVGGGACDSNRQCERARACLRRTRTRRQNTHRHAAESG